jgi:CHAT domain-containing protein
VFTKPQIRSIASLFAGRATVLTSDTPNLADEIAAALDNADFLHLDCHGSFDIDKPLRSGLELGDRKLTIQELLSKAPECRAWLVALSACQTAVTDGARLPEEAIGLPSTFLQFGVANVLGTLWMVDEAATALLMREFYRRCLSGGDLAMALCSAQLWLRSLTKKKAREELVGLGMPRPEDTEEDELCFQDPAYWAGFQITGEA